MSDLVKDLAASLKAVLAHAENMTCELEEEETPPPRKDLGFANGWPGGLMPEEVRRCQALGHTPTETKMPGGEWLVVCPTCNCEFRYDASD